MNLPLGVRDEAEYHQHEIDLEPGDNVFMFTDGVIETHITSDDYLGVQGLHDILNETSSRDPVGIKNSVLNKITHFHNGHPLQDDVSMIAIKVNR